jgi:hypothetical protein
MIYWDIKQGTPEWDAMRVGSVGGTSFGSVISGKKNRLVYELANERLNGYKDEDDYQSEEMLFGVEQEPIARQRHSEQSGIEWLECGIIKAEYCSMHHASPDGINKEATDILEIKSTMNGAIHLQRMEEGPEANHLPQIKNYFVVCDTVERVHWVSFCPYRPEKPLVVWVFERSDFEHLIPTWRSAMLDVEERVDKIVEGLVF